MRTRGSWPDTVYLRKGWALARARPWNDQTESVAALRLERGGDGFLADCATWLARQGIERSLSPALAEAQAGIWRRAGFENHLELTIHERDLWEAAREPSHPITELDDPDFRLLAEIDDRAFNPTWRVGWRGLSEAANATSHSQVMAVAEDGVIYGFVIVGEMGGISYLQRLAVDPRHGRKGIGRSLVRAAFKWARPHGARTMLLNTQPENDAAAALYRSEGFVSLEARLAVLAFRREQ